MGLYSLALFLLSRFPTFPQTSLSHSLSLFFSLPLCSFSLSPVRAEPATLVPLPATRLSFSPLLPTVSLALLPPHAANSSPTLGCSVFLPRPTGSIKTTKCCLSIRWYAHSWSTTLLWHSPSGTGLPTLSRLPLCSSLSLFLSHCLPFSRALFRFSPFSSTAVASFFVLLSEDLRIHGRSLRFLIIPA